jgi:CheY-like chemotaxis protein
LARILVVDDDAAVQVTVRLLLERAGHSVVTADNGRKGLALCQTSDFDLVFLDIFMPGMDGFETMRMVRQHRPLLPIIVISGQSASSEPDKGPDFLTCWQPSPHVWMPPGTARSDRPAVLRPPRNAP